MRPQNYVTGGRECKARENIAFYFAQVSVAYIFSDMPVTQITDAARRPLHNHHIETAMKETKHEKETFCNYW